MHDQSHTVTRLPIHLTQQQSVHFHLGNEEEALEAAANKDTKLTAYFKLNSQDPEFHQYRYCEIPNNCTWQSSSNQWQRRKRGGEKLIARMYSVSPSDQVIYYLGYNCVQSTMYSIIDKYVSCHIVFC